MPHRGRLLLVLVAMLLVAAPTAAQTDGVVAEVVEAPLAPAEPPMDDVTADAVPEPTEAEADAQAEGSPAPGEPSDPGGATETPAPEAESRWSRLGYGLSAAYGAGVAPRSRQRGRDVANVQIISIEPSVRIPMITAGDGSAFYHGRLDGLFTALLMINVEPTAGAAGGVNTGLRYTLRGFGPDRRIEPYGEGTVGVGGLGFGLRSQDDGFSFFVQAGAGARIRLGDSLALVTSIRWQHISNAQTHLPNNGIDTVGVLVGLEVW